MAPGDLDIAGFAVGAVESDQVLGPDRVVAGDVLIGLPSGGLRSNGYTLARHVLLQRAGLDLDGPAWLGSADSLADELLRPSVIYAPAVMTALASAGGASGVHAAAHITGGGIPGNLARVLPTTCDAVVDRAAWSVPRLFGEIARLGQVAQSEMDRVFNLGLGMVLVVAADRVGPVLVSLGGSLEPVVVGTVRQGTGRVVLQ
jgi:phosphoribosylformylglycinamidine cyclo-ligase